MVYHKERIVGNKMKDIKKLAIGLHVLMAIGIIATFVASIASDHPNKD